MSDDKKMVNFKVERETAELAKEKLEHGEMSEKLRQTLYEVAHGTEQSELSRVQDLLKEKRQEKREMEREIQNLQSDRDEIDREIERLEQRAQSLMDQRGEYDGYLSALENRLEEGVRILEGNTTVQEAAEAGGCTPQDVIEDLKNRNSDIPEAAFRQARPSEEPKWRDKEGRINTK